MDKIIKEQYVVSLIVKEMSGTIDEEEKMKLQDWLSENKGNQEAYQRLRKMTIGDEIARYRDLDVKKGWKKYRERYPEKRHHAVGRWSAVAAVAVVLLVSIQVYKLEEKPIFIATTGVGQPGMSKAILVLEDGTEKDLTRLFQEEVLPASKLVMTNDGTAIRYERETGTGQSAGKTCYNTLRVPTRGEYQLVMADGTRVWLNSRTQLRYPVVFGVGERVVYLEGEAYFEVARDEAHPFVVQSSLGAVRVLGTSFGVSAYAGSEGYTTLVTGKVRFESKGEERVTLHPGEQVVVMPSGKWKTRTVDVQEYVGWKNGLFVFNNKPLEEIMRVLERWYGVTVVFKNDELKSQLFTGNLRRYNNIDIFLESLKRLREVHYELSGNTVILYE